MHCMPLFRRCCLVALLVLGLGVCLAGTVSTASAAPLLQQGKKTLFQRVVSHPGAALLAEPKGRWRSGAQKRGALYGYVRL